MVTLNLKHKASTFSSAQGEAGEAPAELFLVKVSRSETVATASGSAGASPYLKAPVPVGRGMGKGNLHRKINPRHH